MRRSLILLAALLVGFGGDRTAGPIEAPAGAPIAPATGASGVHEIAAAAGPSAAAFVRSGAAGVPVVWQESSGPGPRPFTRRAEADAATRWFAPAASARQATLRSHLAAHRTFGSPLALERAGRSSSSTSTPPPFPFV